MNLSLPPFATPTPPGRQLVAATAVAVAVHALLLWGWPRLSLTATRASPEVSTFSTRMVAPPSPAPSPVVAQASPQPAPAPPAPRPRTPPRPVAKAPAPAAAVEPAPPVERQAIEPPAEPPPPAAATQAAPRSAGNDPDASLLVPPPSVGFGGTSAPAPIPAPLAGEALAAAQQWAQRTGDAPVRVPPAARLGYRTSGSVGGENLDLRTTFNWRQDGRAYESNWTVYSPRIGDHSRTNSGLITPQGLLPVRATLRPPDGPTVSFDYAAGRAHFGAAEAELAAGMQDRLGVLVQLGALLAADARRYPVGSVIELPAAHARGPGRWRFAVLGEDSVAGLGRALASVHLLHEAQGADDARIEVWLGRQLDYLPVRVRITEANGDSFEHSVQTAYTETVPGAPAR